MKLVTVVDNKSLFSLKIYLANGQKFKKKNEEEIIIISVSYLSFIEMIK